MKTSTLNLSGGTKTHSIKTKKKKRAKESVPVKVKKKELLSKEEKKAKKKKRKAAEESKALVVTDRPPLTKAERLKMKRIQKRTKLLRSNFKNAVPHIHKLISEDNLTAAMAHASRGFLIMLTELIPILEQTVREKPGQSSVYSLNALVSQVREIQADIKADGEQGDLANRICDTVLRNAFYLLGQHLATNLYHLREQIRPLMPESAHKQFNGMFNKFALDLGTYVDQTRNDTVEKTVALMTVG